MSEGSQPALQVDAAVRVHARSGQTIGPISFEVQPGECFGLVGANGAGKTTLLRLVLALDRADGGHLEALGRAVTAYQPTPGVSGMVEEATFFGWLTAEDNLRATFPDRRLTSAEIDAVLGRVGLAEVAGKRVRAFSQGMRQRLAIARVLLARPRLMVLDEPTNGLDPVGIRWLRDLIEEERAAGMAIILSSHMLHEVQASAQRFLMIDHGRPVVTGKVADISGVNGLEDLYFSSIAES